VPKITGMKLKRARAALTAAHCAVGKVKRAYSTHKKNTIFKQSPKAGTKLANGAKVNVTVSRGRRPAHKTKH
jgi:beta-lactam-binding protein with PASTA domain